MTDKQKLADTLKELAKDGIYRQENVTNAIDGICKALKDCTTAEAYTALRCVSKALLALSKK